MLLSAPKPPWPLRTKPRAAPSRAFERQAAAAGFCRIAGVDEAGRGPWAGPVVASAVILQRPRLSVRIDDSKRLTPRHRLHASHVILQYAEVGFGIVCAEEIDRHNILRATLLAMQRAINDLPTPPDLVLVDGPLAPPMEPQPGLAGWGGIPSDPTPSSWVWGSRGITPTCWPLVRGDQRSYVIACASIMAKVLRDRLMEFYDTLDPRYAFERHKGYGTRLHASRLAQCGPSLFHRRSFKPILHAIAAGADA